MADKEASSRSTTEKRKEPASDGSYSGEDSHLKKDEKKKQGKKQGKMPVLPQGLSDYSINS